MWGVTTQSPKPWAVGPISPENVEMNRRAVLCLCKPLTDLGLASSQVGVDEAVDVG